MNLLPIEHPEKDKIEIVTQKEIDKKQSIIGRIKSIKGHTIFEVNIVEHTIKKAVFEEDLAVYPKEKYKSEGIGIQTYKDGSKKMVIDKLPIRSRKLIKKENCIYVSALNRKNLIKKLVKLGIVKNVK